MSWVRFVPGFSRHPKRTKSGPISSWLWICSIDYCTEHLTDGWIDDAAVPYLCGSLTGPALKRAAESLVKVGSWVRGQGGFWVHDFLRHQSSKDQVEEEREAGRKRFRAWAKQRADKQGSNAVATPLETPKQRSLPAVRPSVGPSGEKRNDFDKEPTKQRQRAHASNGQPDALGKSSLKAEVDEWMAILARRSGKSLEQVAAQIEQERGTPS